MGYVDYNATYENLFTVIYSSPKAVYAFSNLINGYGCWLNKQDNAKQAKLAKVASEQAKSLKRVYKVSGTNFLTTPLGVAKTALISCGIHSSEQMEVIGTLSPYTANTRNTQFNRYLPY